jgi:hypothetical protein
VKSLKNIAGSGLALILTLSAPVAWGQSAPPATVAESGGAENASWSTQDSASLMDQKVSREIQQAWSEGKNATLAMSFQENGEIEMDEGKEKEARKYFQAAEQELATLQPEHASDSN